jgi:hypothetical protein
MKVASREAAPSAPASGRTDDLSRSHLGIVVSVLVAAGLAAGLSWVLTEAWVHTSTLSAQFVDRADYAVVAGLVTLQLMTWSVLATLSVWWQAPRREGRSVVATLARIAGIAVGLGIAFWVLPNVLPLHHYSLLPSQWDRRVKVVGALGAVACAVVVDGLIDLVRAAHDLDATSAAAPAAYRAISSELRRSLMVLGVFLTLVVIVSGAKLNAGNNFIFKTGDPVVPNAYLLVEGAFYAALLLALYLPAHGLIRAKGGEIADAVAGAHPADDPLDQLERVERARDAVGLTQTTRTQLEHGIVLLAPLLTAAITTFVTHGAS